ncbi:UvrD-helicase domain-containing protein [candidate division WOR-3 bacterium]|nr:UvrD-helicase domain-containing protein [candidate division WOR-3 bacterium]
MGLLEELNEEQIKAVKHLGGPALILAGAGSGKTRVITYRIVYLVEQKGISPDRILAVTFTNKAADEMKERLYDLVSTNLKSLWIGTFHSMCARILREYRENTPFSRNFVIYDEQDQGNLIKRIMNNLDMREKELPPYYIKRTISNLKNRLIDEHEFEPMGSKQIRIKEVYIEYQRKLLDSDAMDFDDLLFNTYRLLNSNEGVRRELDRHFKHKLVDEYQDTNHAQYMILKKLSMKNRDLFVVGDDDQSIYGFRGADINNILDFEEDFPDCKIYRLERNYRSTQRILRAASSVVKHNKERKGKTLWTLENEGGKLTIFNGYDENSEARNMVKFLKEELLNHKRNDIMIAYRTNAQSRAIEDELLKEGIEYNIVGGLRFYQRKEIKDLLSYIQFISNKRDSVSLSRILNTPRRSIGRTRRDRIESYAEEKRITLWEAIKEIAREDTIISDFVDLISSLENIEKVDELLEAIIDKTGYIRLLDEEDTVEADSRIENILELLSVVKTFTLKEEKYSPVEYLVEVGLKTDIDEWKRDDSVSLMTLHNTKGLEFPVVFIAGLSEEVLPHYRSIKDGTIEEERRLFYVGLTRSKEKVYLSYYRKRGIGWGSSRMLIPSRFLFELSSEDVDGLDWISKEEREEVLSGESVRDEWVEHPIWGKGKVLKIVDGDKLLISFDGMIKKIKREFFT